MSCSNNISSDARQIAARLLLDAERRGTFANLSLDAQLRRQKLPPQEAAFVGALMYGVLERRLTLDACLAAHSRSPLQKLSPLVLCALRLGVYQLLYMEVPEHAAVSESVELVRTLGKGRAAGFVNGVLRSFLRSDKVIPLPENPAARLSVEFSCPVPLVEMLLENYDSSVVRHFLEDSLGRPPAAVRVNTLRTTTEELSALLEREGATACAHPQIPDCLVVETSGGIAKTQAHGQGLMHIQDISSQLCVTALGLKPGERLLDCCAAPGGKAFTAAQMVGETGEVVACDLHEKRAGLISGRADELGIANITTRVADTSRHHPELGSFDAVLCDVPCSGYGVIRRKPEIKYKPLSQFANISTLQYNILESAAKYLEIGGRLVYSTCTLNPAENAGVTNAFLGNHTQFVPRPLGGLLGECSSRTLLGEFGGDGFYMAAFEKVGG